MKRSAPLGYEEHDFERRPGGLRECTKCGKEIGEGVDPLPLCPGDRDPGDGLSRSSGPPPVSERRAERRKARGMRGPLCDWVRHRRCVVQLCRRPGDPAHVRSVGAGFGDFVQESDGTWAGNVVPLCRDHHEEYDGRVGADSVAFEVKYDLDLRRLARKHARSWMDHRDVDPELRHEHPYEQIDWDGESRGG